MNNILPRFVRKDARIYPDSHCQLCGANCGILSHEPRACRTATCLACETTQCKVNGLSRGQCAVCHIGLLPGWSGTDCTCSYKNCHEKAIARCDGQNRNRCRTHLERGKWAGYVERALLSRWQSWVWKGLD